MRKVLLAILSILYTKDVSIGLCQAIWYLFICFSSLVQFNFPFCLPTYFFCRQILQRGSCAVVTKLMLAHYFPSSPFLFAKVARGAHNEDNWSPEKQRIFCRQLIALWKRKGCQVFGFCFCNHNWQWAFGALVFIVASVLFYRNVSFIICISIGNEEFVDH